MNGTPGGRPGARRFRITVQEVRLRTYEVDVEASAPDAERAARYRVLTRLHELPAVEDRHVGFDHSGSGVSVNIQEVAP